MTEPQRRPTSSPSNPPASASPAPLSPVAEALARRAATRPPRGGIARVAPIQVTPKVKTGRKNRRRIPK